MARPGMRLLLIFMGTIEADRDIGPGTPAIIDSDIGGAGALWQRSPFSWRGCRHSAP